MIIVTLGHALKPDRFNSWEKTWKTVFCYQLKVAQGDGSQHCAG
jgi:hypothetical protein